ncbi:MAG: phage holin family protein [Nitrospira sp.]|nr:phage holin family protein [Nitrospira sp.]
MRGFVLRFIVTGIAVLVAAQIIPGVTIDSFAAGVVGVLVLAILNAVVRPILYVLSAPFIVVTLGLFMVVINALLLLTVSALVPGFYVAGFWPAVGGAVLISLVSVVANMVVADRGHVQVVVSPSRSRKIRHIN